MINLGIAESLEQSGLSISPDFLNKEELQQVRSDFRSVQQQDTFRPATVGSYSTAARHEEIRSDSIYWLERATSNPTQGILWEKMDTLQRCFNRNLFLGLKSFEGHYASFGKGAFYKKHLDCFQQNQTRVISMALYLNDNWQSGDGGELRVFGRDGHQDIQPIGGTLVCFLSAESEHEVRINNTERLSFTGWFRRD